MEHAAKRHRGTSVLGSRRFGWWGLGALLLITAAPTQAQTPPVSIQSQLDRATREYVWVVENHGRRPIVSLRIPHYRGNVLFSPPGWNYEITNQVGLGMKDEPGVITAKAAKPKDAIRQGRPATFRLSFGVNHTAPGKVTATVGFADGTTLDVPGVLVPWPVPWLRRQALLLSFGAVFVVFVLLQIRRGRQAPRPECANADPVDSGPSGS